MKTLREIQVEQHAWSLKNFGPHGPDDPLDGLIEEFGELHHAVLKRRQGIRGTAEEHDAAERDALGDMVIYLLDLLSTIGERIPGLGLTGPARLPIQLRREMLADMADIGRLLETRKVDESAIESITDASAWLIAHMTDYADARGWSLLEIVNETWEQVSQRDWSAAPKDGEA